MSGGSRHRLSVLQRDEVLEHKWRDWPGMQIPGQFTLYQSVL
jgi:hypothetical protein